MRFRFLGHEIPTSIEAGRLEGPAFLVGLGFKPVNERDGGIGWIAKVVTGSSAED